MRTMLVLLATTLPARAGVDAVCRLLAVAALTLLSAPVARAEDQPVTIAPFEVLEGYPGCSGPGKIAYRVAFETRALARFSISGAEFPFACTVKTRKGAEVFEQRIDCPDRAPAGDEKALLDALPRHAVIAADTVGCFGLTSHELLSSRWRITADMLSGRVEVSGDLGSAGLTVAFEGSSFISRLEAPSDIQITIGRPPFDPPSLGFLFDRIPVSSPTVQGAKLSLSTYVVVAPEPLQRTWCRQTACDDRTLSADWLIEDMGILGASDVTRFIEEQ